MTFHIDFLGRKWWFIGASLVLMAVSVGLAIWIGINYGIDFKGGTEIILRCREARDVQAIRESLTRAGYGSAVIQSYGDPAVNEFLVRVQEGGDAGEGGSTIAGTILEQLRTTDRPPGTEGKTFDVNASSPEEWTAFLEAAVPGRGAELAGLIRDWQAGHGGVFATVEEVVAVSGIPAEAGAALKERAYAGNYVQLKADVVGPTVGKELRQRATLAVIFSLIGILVYVWLRFELNFGLGAVLCLFHDVTITLGVLVLAQEPFDVTCVAALLTIVGYSINDTIVIFDRVRENLRVERSLAYEDLFNKSINQTLSRTLLTNGLTFIVVLSLLFFGGPVLHGFSLALTVGMIVGTYSTIYIASPIAIWAYRWRERWKAGREERARKARSRGRKGSGAGR